MKRISIILSTIRSKLYSVLTDTLGDSHWTVHCPHQPVLILSSQNMKWTSEYSILEKMHSIYCCWTRSCSRLDLEQLTKYMFWISALQWYITITHDFCKLIVIIFMHDISQFTENCHHTQRVTCYDFHVVENEIINIVKLCKPKNSKDCDDISMYVISKVIVSIAKPLAHIFNLSFSCGIFPDHMKIAKLFQYLKTGRKPSLLITDQFPFCHNSQKY